LAHRKLSLRTAARTSGARISPVEDIMTASRYRFLLIHAFQLPASSPYLHRPITGPKEQCLPNYELVKPVLEGVEWELHPGPLAPYGDWAVENREEFALVAAGRLPIVKEACASGKYNAIVLLGGGEPGFPEAREIARPFGIPVTSCAFSQMHIATMLGNKFSVIDLAESHSMYYYNLVIQHRFDHRCASIRNVHIPFMRPGHPTELSPQGERQKAMQGARSAGLADRLRRPVHLECDRAEQDRRRIRRPGRLKRGDEPWLTPTRLPAAVASSAI
jgi:hypothetical protein